MNKIYFVRHASPDYLVHDDFSRPLTEKGMEEAKDVTIFFEGIKIDKVYSSPYVRAVDTVKNFADKYDLEIELIEDFRERKISNEWIEDFSEFSKNQWENFDYKMIEGESLREVQNRNIKALNSIAKKHNNENIIIGTHGTALSTIINFYNRDFGYCEFERIKSIMPWIVCITFNNEELVNIVEYTCSEKINA